MKSLSRRQREAVILAGVGGLSSEDAASVIDCRPTAAKSRVSRARHAMLSMLDGRAPLKHWRDKDDATKELAGELALQTAHPLSKKRSAKAT